MPDNEMINFLQSANKCLAIQKYFAGKAIANLIVHVIPQGQANENTIITNESGLFTLDPDVANDWRRQFYAQCYAIKQSDIIPDANRESSLANYIRIPQLEDFILNQFAEQIPLYKKKQAYTRVIPPNYFNPEYRFTQPGFDEFNLRLKSVAKQNKLRKKFIPLFVAQ